LGKRELQIWTKHKNKLIKGKKCDSCGKQAETMHHPKPRGEYASFEEYLNETNLTPVCHWCHYTVYHKGNPYHMLWRKCKYRGNIEIRSLPEYRQKKIIYKDFCQQCSDKKECLAIPIVTLEFGHKDK